MRIQEGMGWVRKHRDLLVVSILLGLAPVSYFEIPPWRAPTVLTITEISGEAWIGTYDGAYRMVKEEAIPVLERRRVKAITEIGGEAWIGAQDGAYRVVKGETIPVELSPRGVLTITEISGEAWIGTYDGAYRMVKGEAIPVLKGWWVNTITEISGEAWIGTNDGAYRMIKGEAVLVLRGRWVYAITEISGEAWIGTYDGAYRMVKGEAIPVFKRWGVNTITEIAGEAWIGTDDGAYRVVKGEAIPVLEGREVYAITEIAGEAWIGTDDGAYRVKSGEVIHMLDKPWIRLTREGLRYLCLFLLVFFVTARVSQRATKWRKRQLQQRRLAFEMKEAERLMEKLFPKEATFERPGIHLAHRRIQATTISGDFYNFIPRGDGSLGVYFVDVEGHGLPASLHARDLYNAVTQGEWGMGDARAELEKADGLVRRGAIFQKEEVVFFCMNFTEIDPEHMEIRHANAGMPFPLLFRWGQAQPEPLQAAGVYVGAGYNRYPVKPSKAETKIGDGDLLVIASDGILEARDSRGRTFGQKGITVVVNRTRLQSPQEIADEIILSVQRHTGKEEPEDDQILVVVLIGEPVAGTRLTGVKTLERKNGVFSLMNAGNTGTACHNELRQQLKTWVQNQEFGEARTNQVWTSTWEAIQNAVKYGSRPGDVIHIRLIPPGKEKLLEVEVIQPFLWEDWDKCLGERMKKEIQTDRILMGGTVIMLWLTDDIQVENQGRKITMRFSPKGVPGRKVSLPSS